MSNKIKVMIVDDSALVRKVLADVLNSDPMIEVIAQAQDPVFALQKLERFMPDVITLDIEMPRMDGLTFLRKIMAEQPVPVVMCSSQAQENAAISVEALRSGAADIIAKPQIGVKGFIEESAIEIIDTVKAAARVKLRKRKPDLINSEPKRTADAVIRKGKKPAIRTTERLIAIGASTGGTEALRNVMAAFPVNTPGIVIVQHMPANFTNAFARHLDEISQMEVREAVNGDEVHDGLALLAPGGKHLLVKQKAGKYYVEVVDGPLVSRHRPSVDVMFRSVARYVGNNAAACIMTGMGDDGAAGLKEILDAGGRTFAQDEDTCVVFGMPKEAFKIGAAEKLVPLNRIAGELLNAKRKEACKSAHII